MLVKKPIRSPWQTESSLIEEIIDNFDFEKCQKVMEFLNWSWVSVGTPNVENLKDSARNRLRECIDACKSKNVKSDSGYSVSSGGLKATVSKNRYGHINWAELEFVLTDWGVDYEIQKG
jgi:hypothetical protein